MQTTKKRIVLVLLTMVLSVSGSLVTFAQTGSDALLNAQQQLQQKERILEQKQLEQQSVTKEITNIQQELASLLDDISKNKETMAATQQKIDATNQLIEKKKEEIVELEDKMLARQEIMKKRAVAMQQNSNVNMIINLFFESDSISDFIQRASAASQLLDADKDILTAQKQDLKQIEKDKAEIDRQETLLEEEQENLVAQQNELDQNMQKRQQTLTAMQEKYNQISQQVALAAKEKSGIESQMNAIKAAMVKPVAKQVTYQTKDTSGAALKGKEMYVTATAYTAQSSGRFTRAGYDIVANPNIKLIAVDPSVIPLGSKVWVEGYGVAVAGDTGGAIHGHIIDCLFPTNSQALAWGRKTVKIIVLQ